MSVERTPRWLPRVLSADAATSVARARRVRWIARAALIALCVGTLSGGASAEGDSPSILHEFIPPDPAEDISFSATTLDGNLPAAIQTPSGVATAPDPERAPSNEHVYSGGTTDDSPGSTYEPDRDTRRPNVEHYDDPFSPSTVPFKRLRAYDSIDESYTLRVQNQALAVIPVGGSVGQGDEPFYGDISVDLIPNQPVRIPTVGPGARVLRLHTNPDLAVDIVRDGADNWFARGPFRTRVRLVVELAIERAAFGSDFADVEWSALAKQLVFQPIPKQEASFVKVAQAIGISRAMRPRDVVRKMVDYFRSFEPSDDPPRGNDDIYLDLALSKKGVCRHRSFAFLVTALYIGLPARMVVNEAHAWVEVNDGSLWHRIDLGGAAANLENDTDPNKPRYVPPQDPYDWPAQSSSDSGQGLADRTAAQNAPDSASSATPNASSTSAPSAPPPSASASASASAAPVAPGETTDVEVTPVDTEVRRGFPFHLRGDVKNNGAPCSHIRVDVVLMNDAFPKGVTVGSLSTDEQGHYDGAVVIPRDLTLGDYGLRVETPGDGGARCPAGQSK